MMPNLASGVPDTVDRPTVTGTNQAGLYAEKYRRNLPDWFHNVFRYCGPQKIITNHETDTTSQYR